MGDTYFMLVSDADGVTRLHVGGHQAMKRLVNDMVDDGENPLFVDGVHYGNSLPFEFDETKNSCAVLIIKGTEAKVTARESVTVYELD